MDARRDWMARHAAAAGDEHAAALYESLYDDELRAAGADPGPWLGDDDLDAYQRLFGDEQPS